MELYGVKSFETFVYPSHLRHDTNPAAAHREHHLQLWCQRHGCDGGLGGWPAAGWGDGLKFLSSRRFCQLRRCWLESWGTQKRNRPFQLHVRTFRQVLWRCFVLALCDSLLQDFPLIRVAWNEKGQKWYSADNRRLFIYKVVAPLISLQQVEVGERWTTAGDLSFITDELVFLPPIPILLKRRFWLSISIGLVTTKGGTN